METQTRYDLNAAIEHWRAELAAQAGLTMDVRRELETHLCDAITGFQQRGLNDEESFWLACKRVGQPPQLAAQFQECDPGKVWFQRMAWMLMGALGINFLRFVKTTWPLTLAVSLLCLALTVVWFNLPARTQTKLRNF